MIDIYKCCFQSLLKKVPKQQTNNLKWSVKNKKKQLNFEDRLGRFPLVSGLVG